jgi:hypothetical protein
LTPPGLIGSTTIDCAACMEKANTLRDGRRNKGGPSRCEALSVGANQWPD